MIIEKAAILNVNFSFISIFTHRHIPSYSSAFLDAASFKSRLTGLEASYCAARCNYRPYQAEATDQYLESIPLWQIRPFTNQRKHKIPQYGVHTITKTTSPGVCSQNGSGIPVCCMDC
jgi:hypothetical protein